MTLLHDLRALLGRTPVLTGADLGRFTHDWSGPPVPRP